MKGIYLDQAATSYPKPQMVSDTVLRCMRDIGGNPGRSGHFRSIDASRVLFEARHAVSRLFNIADSSHVAFTLNATDALNMAIKGGLSAGVHVVTTSMEHNSVMRPLASLARRGVISLTVVDGEPNGSVQSAKVIGALQKDTAMVVMTHASNITGAINDIEEISAYTRSTNIVLLVDAAQTAGVLPIDVQRMGIDVLACSGHKALLGPQGTGVLYANPDRVDLGPWREGGTGSFSELDAHPDMLPDRWEAGTPNTPGIAGLGAAVDHLLSVGVREVRRHEQALLQRLAAGLALLPGMRLYGPIAEGCATSAAGTSTCGNDLPASRVGVSQTGVLSLTVAGFDTGDLARFLEERYGIVCRAGLHCAPSAHRTIGTFPEGTLRLSLGLQNSISEIDYAIGAFRELTYGEKA